ncbi:hypothetical protein OTU49_002518, partial [Cherax quadricarinatus]
RHTPDTGTQQATSTSSILLITAHSTEADMIPARLTKLLVLASLLIAAAVDASRCSSNTIECNTGGVCISISHVCASGKQCNDGSDEDPSICKNWKYRDSTCGNGNVYCRNRCVSISSACSSGSECPQSVNSHMCEMIQQRKLIVPIAPSNSMNI